MQASAIDVIASTLDAAAPALGQFSSPDGALSLLLSDLVDGAAIRAQLGEERWAELLRDHRALVSAVVAAHDGEVAREQDDGCMVAFSSAHAAVHCAVDLQRGLAGRPVGGLAAPLELRVGVHTGFVIVDADDFMGRNVVLAARIAAAARAGEILVSAAVREYTENDASLRFVAHGEYHFKGLVGQHEVHAIAWAP